MVVPPAQPFGCDFDFELKSCLLPFLFPSPHLFFNNLKKKMQQNRLSKVSLSTIFHIEEGIIHFLCKF